MEELFGDKNVDTVPAVTGEEEPIITQEEVESAIERLKNNKASGTDLWKSPQTTGSRTDKTTDEPLQQNLHRWSNTK